MSKRPRYNAIPYDGWAWYMAEQRKRRRQQTIWRVVYAIMLVAALYVSFWIVVLLIAGALLKGHGRMTQRAMRRGKE